MNKQSLALSYIFRIGDIKKGKHERRVSDSILTQYLLNRSRYTTFPSPTRSALVGSPLQWLTAIYHFTFSPIFRYTRIQTSSLLTQEHACYLINTYKVKHFYLLLQGMRCKDLCYFNHYTLLPMNQKEKTNLVIPTCS